MAKKRSKKPQQRSSSRAKVQKSSSRSKTKDTRLGLWSRVKSFWAERQKASKRAARVNPHKSFKRTYREDYKRDLKVPSITYHVMNSFRLIFKNWKLFLPFLVILVILNAVFVGIMDQTNYEKYQDILDDTSEQVSGGDIGAVAKAGLLLISTVSTGGLSGGSSEASTVFTVLLFLLIWLVTIFIMRHRMAGHDIKLRDGLYNAMTPLVSTLIVFVVALIQCVPIFILVVVYSAAVQTEFLATPFYALVFFIFAALMIILSTYLLSSSLMALVAVSAPGLYPMKALRTASDLMMGRRIRFILRLVALLLVIALMWVVVMLPLIMFDLFMKQFEWTSGIPFVPFCLTAMTCFTCIYLTVYLYIYYRWMLDN